MITQERLRELFDYNPKTGVFTRIATAGSRGPAGVEAGTLNNMGYLRVMIDRRSYLAHRLAWLWVFGNLPPAGSEVDHINGIGTDNRIRNLRLVTHRQNSRNQVLNCRNTSGHAGVHYLRRKDRWLAYIRVDGRWKHLGEHDRFEDACRVRKQAEQYHGFSPTHGRARAA